MKKREYILGLAWYTVKLIAVIHTFAIACTLSQKNFIDPIAFGSMLICTWLALNNTKVKK